MDDRFDDYRKHPNGEVVTWPISGWEGFYAYGDTCAFRVRALTSQEQMDKNEFESIQLALTPTQCRAMSEFLLKMAKLAEDAEVKEPNLVPPTSGFKA